MARLNKRAKEKRFHETKRLAGGSGQRAAVQGDAAALRRLMMTYLLWENGAYVDGKTIANQIKELVPKVDPYTVANMAVEAREQQKLRHVPLFIAREMARHATHRGELDWLLPRIIKRADEITEFVAIYWKDGKQPLANAVKRGLAASFNNFDRYQFSKYNRGTEIKFKDVMFLVHPKPARGKKKLFDDIANDKLGSADTWETRLSTRSSQTRSVSRLKSSAEKRADWEGLLRDNKLGSVALLRNLRNMDEVGVDRKLVGSALSKAKTTWLLPINYLAASKYAPRYAASIETLMLRSLSALPKLEGRTILIVDVSGSMNAQISSKSEFSRLDAAASMAIQAREMCEDVVIYITGGNDRTRIHGTQVVPAHRGFGLYDYIRGGARRVGGGGIFTRQCIEHIRKLERNDADRIIVFSDSQDCDTFNKQPAAPFGTYNYIVDVSPHKYGVNYKGTWTAEVSGWSEHFLNYIAALEGANASNEWQ